MPTSGRWAWKPPIREFAVYLPMFDDADDSDGLDLYGQKSFITTECSWSAPPLIYKLFEHVFFGKVVNPYRASGRYCTKDVCKAQHHSLPDLNSSQPRQ